MPRPRHAGLVALRLVAPAVMHAAVIACAAGQGSGSDGPGATTPGEPSTPAPEPGQGQGQGQASGQIRLADLQPAVRLGVRAEVVRRGWPALRTVVVVPDEASYLRAIAAWSYRGRYPVLIDDGSASAREDVARFVRAYKPAKVLRWSAPQAVRDAWGSADRAGRRAAMETAITDLWRQPLPSEQGPATLTPDQLPQRWIAFGAPPPGLVLADEDDPARAAAVALSAGRLQPIVWIDKRSYSAQGVNGTMPPAEFDKLAADLRAAAEATKLPFSQLGDVLDAVTICVDLPGKVQEAADKIFATTDLLGRDNASPEARSTAPRWAWTGQIFGSAPRSAYMAMSSMFLSSGTAWLFDGYPNTDPWKRWDVSAAAAILRQGKLEASVEDTPRQGERQWRMRTALGVDASLIAVTTKGMAHEFNLEPGRCLAADVPLLRVPAMVYFVHSFSAAAPASRVTVAGRFLERGAYAYFGSVYEPYLQAFPPTDKAAARLVSNYPFAAALRADDGPAWRLTSIGDPLAIVSPEPLAPASAGAQEAGPALEGAEDVEAGFRAALAEKRWVEAIVALTVLGRDDDAARLAAALMRDEKARGFTPDVAAVSILPLLRARRPDDLAQAYAQLGGQRGRDPVLRDALWAACYPELDTTTDGAMLSTLAGNLREEHPGRDAADLAPAIARVLGRDAAAGVLDRAAAVAGTPEDKGEIERARQRLASPRGR